MSNPWIGFLQRHGGKGYTRDELRSMYHSQQHGGGCEYDFVEKQSKNVKERFSDGSPKRESSSFEIDVNCKPNPSKKDSIGCVTAKNLYREHCTFYNGLFVKDMARLGRALEDVIIIDNSPNSFLF